MSKVRHSEQLAGRELEGGWRVIARIPQVTGQTGGRYSTCYSATNLDGREGFLKAVDLSWALEQPDPTTVLQLITEAYNFERDLLLECKDLRMDRVVHPLAHGVLTVDPLRPEIRVPYLIFERGSGDVRLHLERLDSIDVAWILRVLHQITVGLGQLHAANVAHQDLKPSNVMLFGARESKVGDLGHAVRRGAPLARPEHDVVGGDPSHAPPEQLFDAVPTDWGFHRIGGDLYHLGSMIVFLFTGITMTALLLHELPAETQPQFWKGKYADVMPFLRDAFERGLRKIEGELPIQVRSEMITAIRQLCDPDPFARGHPQARAMKHGNPHSLDRYRSQFDLLARSVERDVRVKRA